MVLLPIGRELLCIDRVGLGMWPNVALVPELSSRPACHGLPCNLLGQLNPTLREALVAQDRGATQVRQTYLNI